MNPVRFGLLGAAFIARKNWKSIRHAANCMLRGVASRDPERAEQYIELCMHEAPMDPRPEVFASYEALLASDQIDAVYVPLPTALRKEWVIKAAQAGKHVLCEKPCAVSVADLKEMLAACRENNVQFMDGVMFMHSRRLDVIRDLLDDPQAVGKINRITTQFSFHGDQSFLDGDIRLSESLEPDGCLGDLGWYTSRLILWVMRYEMPEAVSGRLLKRGTRSDSGDRLPLEFSAELFFSGGVSASFFCGFTTEHQQWAHISGEKGSLWVDDFVLPYLGPEISFEVNNPAFNVIGCDFNMERHTRRIGVREYSSAHEDAQETNLFRNFAKIVASGSLEPHWPEIALKTQRILEAVRRSADKDGALIELG